MPLNPRIQIYLTSSWGEIKSDSLLQNLWCQSIASVKIWEKWPGYFQDYLCKGRPRWLGTKSCISYQFYYYAFPVASYTLNFWSQELYKRYVTETTPSYCRQHVVHHVTLSYYDQREKMLSTSLTASPRASEVCHPLSISFKCNFTIANYNLWYIYT